MKTPNLITIRVGAKTRVIYSVLYWDFFYWPKFIVFPLKSLKLPLRHLSVLSASKILLWF